MKGPQHILLTGITGSVGSEVVRWLSSQEQGLSITALIRARSPEELRRRWQQAVAEVPASANREGNRWRPLAGDITLPNLGLSDTEAFALRKDITHIIHAAADVRFLAPLEALRRVNVEGTRNVLEFAAGCRRLVQCAHLSTLFVAGRRTGTILEHELEHDAGFINHYEHSKFEAEILARQFMNVVPLVVYRLAMLPGRSSDGFVHQFVAFHQVLYFYHRGSLTMVPGKKENRIDIAPTDWATDILMRMFLQCFDAGRTCHICSGENAVQAGELVALTSRCFSEVTNPGHQEIAPLALVNSSTYDRSLIALSSTGTARSRQIARTLSSMTPYALLSRVFDRQHVRESLKEAAMAPQFKAYYPSIVRYCVRTNWRKGNGSEARTPSVL